MRNIRNSTKDFEGWLRAQTDVHERCLDEKHKKMADGAFPFLRATFYRWAELWPEVCSELDERDSDVLLAVGDLHVENFGTWRDSRNRLVWGMNDFDEAAELPFSSDLVRLGVSTVLAAEMASIDAPLDDMCRWLLSGYEAGLEAGGGPIFMDDGRYPELTQWVRNAPDPPEKFWEKRLDEQENPPVDPSDLNAALFEIFRASFPRRAKPAFLKQRKPRGLGSLGRRRFTAVIGKQEERVAREAKALAPSAVYWVEGRINMPSQTATLLQRAIRSPDPFSQIHDKWLMRQLAPGAVKLDLPENRNDARLALAPALISLMGRETANIHLGTHSPKQLADCLAELSKHAGGKWLANAVEKMADATRADHRDWTQRR